MLFQEDSIIKKDPIKNNTPFTVTEISLIIKQYIESSFQNIEIKGEVSGIKIANSGHIYFSLKDENAVLNAICWRYIATKLPIQLEDGMEIICEGNISTYPGRSNYQIIIKNIKLAGEGILLAKLEEIRKKLTIEGIFDEKYKKRLPKIPQKIAIVTSLQGAVIRDIIHRLKDRFPIKTLVWDVIVQGNEAAGYIVEAIEGLNNLPKNISSPDIIIVARGGGSIEDLWPFNEEIVVRAVFNSTIPIISAIGHETDTTLIDLVADKRAPTPTAAAELITPDKSQIIDKLNKFKITLNNILPNLINYKSTLLKSLLTNLSSTTNYFENLRNKFKNFNVLLDVKFNSLYKLYNLKLTSLKLSSLNLHRLIITNQDKLSNSVWRINELYKNKLNKMSDNLLSNKKLLISYNHKNILKRGFSLIRDYKNNKLIKSCNELKKDKLIKIELYDGIIHGQLKSVQNKKNRALLEDKTKIKTQNKLPFSLE